MPNLGETWSGVESSGSPSSIEGVVIATGPTLVRLVTRTGRRISAPMSSLARSWRLLQKAPEDARTCSRCRQSAFFRHTIEGPVAWVCEDHLPQGARAYFPGDVITESSPRLEMSCPLCSATNVEMSPSLITLPNQRATTLCSCGSCGCVWSPLISLGLGDDGLILAQDLSHLKDSGRTMTDIRVGFVAYRGLCRALGMGDVNHIGGVALRQDQQLGDMLTIVCYGLDRIPSTQPTTPKSEVTPVFGSEFPDWKILPGSVWKRRTSPVTCEVIAATTSLVTYKASGEADAREHSRKDFLRRWVPRNRDTVVPEAQTMWRHIETQQLVQVTEPTLVQAINHQVPYVTSAGRQETTPCATFYRLYQELPMPPEDHLWHRRLALLDEDPCAIFEVEREGTTFYARPYGAEGPLLELTCQEFCATFDALQFFDWFIDITVDLAQDDIKHALRAGTSWALKSDSTERVLFIEVAEAGDRLYASFRSRAQDHFESADDFLAKYEYLPPDPPCKEGETWVSLASDTIQCTILIADVPPFERAVLQWHDGTQETMAHAKLTALYRRLDIRSYWEILDMDESP